MLFFGAGQVLGPRGFQSRRKRLLGQLALKCTFNGEAILAIEVLYTVRHSREIAENHDLIQAMQEVEGLGMVWRYATGRPQRGTIGRVRTEVCGAGHVGAVRLKIAGASRSALDADPTYAWSNAREPVLLAF